MWESYSKTLSNLKEALLEPCCSLLSCVQLSATPKTIAYQASLSMGIPRQEDQRGLPIPSAGDLPHPGTEPCIVSCLLHCQENSLPLSHQESLFRIYCTDPELILTQTADEKNL